MGAEQGVRMLCPGGCIPHHPAQLHSNLAFPKPHTAVRRETEVASLFCCVCCRQQLMAVSIFTKLVLCLCPELTPLPHRIDWQTHVNYPLVWPRWVKTKKLPAQHIAGVFFAGRQESNSVEILNLNAIFFFFFCYTCYIVWLEKWWKSLNPKLRKHLVQITSKFTFKSTATNGYKIQ